MHWDVDILGWTWKPVWILMQDFKAQRFEEVKSFQYFSRVSSLSKCNIVSHFGRLKRLSQA